LKIRKGDCELLTHKNNMSYVWNLPTKVLFGAGQIKRLIREEFPGKKALVVISSGNSVRENGSLQILEKILEDKQLEYYIFDKINSNPGDKVLEEAILFCKENQCDFVIGLGGGSVIDAATVIAALAPQNTFEIWEYIAGGSGKGKKMDNPSLPYIAITTSAGTGSEVDCWGVVTNSNTHEKIALQCSYPMLAVIDPELMITVPSDYTAYQGFDALFHNIEGYLSRFANEASEMMELEAIRNIAQYLPIAIKEGDNIVARTKIAYASVLGGYSMELSSCISQHAIEHVMSGYHEKLSHGAGLLMISNSYFALWIEKHVCDDRFIKLAKVLGMKEATEPEDFLKALDKLKRECNVNKLKMSDYGIQSDEFVNMAKEAKVTMKSLFFNDRVRVTEENIVKILEESYL